LISYNLFYKQNNRKKPKKNKKFFIITKNKKLSTTKNKKLFNKNTSDITCVFIDLYLVHDNEFLMSEYTCIQYKKCFFWVKKIDFF